MAVPGSGVVQTLADNGRSKSGFVTSADKWEDVEPFVKVFKDGYSLVGCIKDQMHDFGDMYGDNKDQYREGNLNVSIVKYSEVVLKEKQVPMTPKKCYEFCRTVPDMVFFGVKGGRDCYCMPFYKPGTGKGGCDMPCAGDPIQMCGGEEKSSIFEMHMCADTAGDLLYKSVKAEVATACPFTNQEPLDQTIATCPVKVTQFRCVVGRRSLLSLRCTCAQTQW